MMDRTHHDTLSKQPGTKPPGVPSTFSDDMLWLLLLGFALLGLYRFGRLLPDTAVLVLWLTTTVLIALGHFLRLRIRRQAWLHAYVAPSSALQQWLRGGLVALLIRTLMAAALAVALIIGTLRLTGPGELLLLLASLPLLAGLRWGAGRSLARHISPHYLPESAWRVAIALTFVILCTGLLAQSWWRPGPDFTAVSLDQAAWYLALEESAESAVLERALAVAGAMEGVRWWLAQHGLARLQWPSLELLGWLLVLLKSAVFVSAWLHCCVGVMLMRTLWETSDAASDPIPLE